MQYVSDTARYANIIFIELYLVLSYIEKLISTAYFLFVILASQIVGLGYTIYFWYVHKLRLYICLRAFIVVIYMMFNSN